MKAEGSQAPQDLMALLQASSTTSLVGSQRHSYLSACKDSRKIHGSSQGLKGFSTASGTFPAPPTAFPQRQMVFHVALSSSYQHPVVAVVYSQITPEETNDGSILRVESAQNTTSSQFLGLNCESVISLWSLKDAANSTSPGAVLMCHSSLVCCDLHAVGGAHSGASQNSSHGAATAGLIVVGGCKDGSICVWDTRCHPHMHCMWQEPSVPTLDSAGNGGGVHVASQTAVYAPAFSTICPDDSTAGTAPAMSGDEQGVQFEFEGLERLEEIVQVAIVAEGRSEGSSGGSKAFTEGSGNLSLLVLSATGVVSLWAVVVARSASRTAAGAFLLNRHGAARKTFPVLEGWK